MQRDRHLTILGLQTIEMEKGQALTSKGISWPSWRDSEAIALQEKDSCSPFSTQVYRVYLCRKQERVNSKVFAPKWPRNADSSATLAFSTAVYKIIRVLGKLKSCLSRCGQSALFWVRILHAVLFLISSSERFPKTLIIYFSLDFLGFPWVHYLFLRI